MSQTFAFRAVDTLGAKVNGEVESESRENVAEMLRGRGLVALEVKLKTKSAELSFDRFARVGLEDLSLMTRQLATMISSGLALMRALTVLETQTENPKLKATIITVRQDIETGASLSDALERHPKVFSELYVAMIRAGETGGFLEDSLIRVSDQLESQNRLKRQVKGAMVYPAVVCTIAIGVLVAMLDLHHSRVRRRLQAVRRDDADPDQGHDRRLQRDAESVVSGARDRFWRLLRLSQVEELQGRTPGLGSPAPQGAGQDRTGRPESRARPLGAHHVVPDNRRGTDARGDRGHGPDRRQYGRRDER